jgi:oligoribonuclease (3'-5' exoribonuclease)
MPGPVSLVVVDLETTELDPQVNQILEIGAIAVDKDLVEISRFQTYVHFDRGVFEPGHYRLPTPLVDEMHTKNGLWDLCQAWTGDEDDASEAFASWLQDLKACTGLEMAGNSIHFDLGFLKARMPEAAFEFGYRIRDFGAIGRELQACGIPFAPTPKEEYPHRSLADCEIELNDARRMRMLLRASEALAAELGARARVLGLGQVGP